MHHFLSDGAIIRHKEHLNGLRLRLSVLEKSIRGTAGPGIGEIPRMRIPDSDKRELCRLKREIIAHEVYFSSFGRKNPRARESSEFFGREAELLYRLYREALSADGGFLLLLTDKRGGLRHISGREALLEIYDEPPRLAVDLCEHAYFSDYGFEYGDYLKSALVHLDLGKL